MTQMASEFEHLVRQESHRRNLNLEDLLKELNELLAPVEQSVQVRFQAPRWPVVLVVGAPRSGTTLMTQWLAASGQFAYPSNLLSRFYRAPYIGARIQQLLTDPAYQYRAEFAELSHARPSFESSLGKTQGILAPNEFWYFWRRFFPYQDIHYLNQEALANIDKATFISEIAAIEGAFGKAVAMKGMIVNCNLEYINSILDKAVFVYTKRKPFYNVQSLLSARRDYSGTIDDWYSFRPQEYPILKELDPYLQVAGQIHYLNQAIETALREMPAERQLQVQYEDFCGDPAKVYAQLRACCLAQGYELDANYLGPSNFSATDRITATTEETRRIVDAIAYFSPESAQP
jgi:hypothetical protein